MLTNNHVFTDVEISCAKHSKNLSAEEFSREVALCLDESIICRYCQRGTEIIVDLADDSKYKISVEKLTK